METCVLNFTRLIHHERDLLWIAVHEYQIPWITACANKLQPFVSSLINWPFVIVINVLPLLKLTNTLNHRSSSVHSLCMVTGNDEALQMLVQHKAAMSTADNRGWIPLHQAAAQPEKGILEITFSGLNAVVQIRPFTGSKCLK